MAWKTVDGQKEASHLQSQLLTLIDGMLNKETLLELVRHFIVFKKTSREYIRTKMTTIETEKKLAAYHQYYAVKKALISILEASKDQGNRKGGVIWHTRGSGKGKDTGRKGESQHLQ